MNNLNGNRKVILTKWMLVIFTIITVGYLVLLGLKGKTPPESFYMSFVLGLGAIGGAFTAGNIFEHKYNFKKKISTNEEE